MIQKLSNIITGVPFMTVITSTAFTALETARVANIPAKEMAKVVVFWMDGAMNLVVVPSSGRINFELLKAATKTKEAETADESDIKGRFEDCVVGAMPPFGSLFNMKTFVEGSLLEGKNITFKAGSHTELITMPVSDFLRLEKPLTGKFLADPGKSSAGS